VLITGMSGTGKSSVLRELATLGFQVVDTDEEGWKELRDDGEWVWRADRMHELLSHDHVAALVVSGCVANQGYFRSAFDAVVLLSAPAGVLMARISSRIGNDFGKSEEERAAILDDLAHVEPMLRATCTHEIDASQPLPDVVAAVAAIAMPASIRLRPGE
jgi:dephospho-CoA kinase